MRVITWNLNGAKHLHRATAAQQEQAWSRLRELGGDILLLQEVVAAWIPSWARDRWALHGVSDIEPNWGSMVAVGRGLQSEQADRAEPWLDVVGSYVSLATVNLDGQSVLFASVHAPAREADNFLRVSLAKPGAISNEDLARVARPNVAPWALDVIFAGLERRVGQRFVVGGDLNEARLFDTVDPAKYRGSGAAFFARAEARGWRECCCTDGEQRTFLRRGTEAYQLDHVFCDNRTHSWLRSVSVVPEARVEGISDHLPVVVELEPA